MKKAVCILLIAMLFTLWAPVCSADETEQEITALLEEYMEKRGLNEDKFAMGWMDLETGESWYFGEENFMVAGSMYKLPLAITIYDMLAEGTITGKDKSGGFTVENALYYSIVYSNNEAAQALRYVVSNNLEEYRNTIAQYSGYETGELPDTYYSENRISPRYLINTLKYLYDNSEQYPELLENMKKSTKGHYFQKDNGGLEIAHKYGAVENVMNDCGIIYTSRPFALVVFTKYVYYPERVLSEICAMMAEYSERVKPEPEPEPEPDPIPVIICEPMTGLEPEHDVQPAGMALAAAVELPSAQEPSQDGAGINILFIAAALAVILAVGLMFLKKRGRIPALLLLTIVLAELVAARNGILPPF